MATVSILSLGVLATNYACSQLSARPDSRMADCYKRATAWCGRPALEIATTVIYITATGLLIGSLIPFLPLTVGAYAAAVTALGIGVFDINEAMQTHRFGQEIEGQLAEIQRQINAKNNFDKANALYNEIHPKVPQFAQMPGADPAKVEELTLQINDQVYPSLLAWREDVNREQQAASTREQLHRSAALQADLTSELAGDVSDCVQEIRALQHAFEEDGHLSPDSEQTIRQYVTLASHMAEEAWIEPLISPDIIDIDFLTQLIQHFEQIETALRDKAEKQEHKLESLPQ